MSATAAAASPLSRPTPTPRIVLGSVLFTVWTYGLLVVMALACTPLLLGPRRWTWRVVKLWARLVLGGLRLLCGVRVETRGLEHLPRGPVLIAAKHLSMLDTVAPLLWLDDPAYVLKRELLRLPFFGWYATKVDMLPVDRAGGAAALRTLVQGAKARLDDGRQVLIFPEGTRQAPGAPPDYKPGIAGLYRELGVACTPLATNSGLFWPAHGVLRYPGVVVFEVLPPIPAGLKRAGFMTAVEAAIETASDRLIAEARPPLSTSAG